ncbi:MAG TPA: hypothetical protein VGI79_02280 [Caulobacteraceae bacterium]|jgi:hypothetical protein
MKSNIPKIRLGFLILFAVLCAAMITYQIMYVWPAQRCEAVGDWWDPRDRVCAVPIPISQFTGRKIDGKLVVTPNAQKTPVRPAR